MIASRLDGWENRDGGILLCKKNAFSVIAVSPNVCTLSQYVSYICDTYIWHDIYGDFIITICNNKIT